MRHHHRSLRSFILSATMLFFTGMLSQVVQAGGYEVWVTDQNNTVGYSTANPRGTHGGRLLIYDSADLDREEGPLNQPTIYFMDQMFAVGGPNNTTGAAVTRPHMLAVNPMYDYVALTFVSSGHVAILHGTTKQPKAFFRMSTGYAGQRQAHAALWTPDGQSLVVANQNGRLLERIVYDPSTDTFAHDTAATLDLATCTTPNGFPCQSTTPLEEHEAGYIGPNNRPDNAPICPFITDSGKTMVTLRGGGLLVVDPQTTPMSIVAEYGTSVVGRDGCGAIQHKKNIYLNSGAGALSVNGSEISLYEFKDHFPSAPEFLAPNAPGHLPDLFFRDNGPGRDVHGQGITAGGNYLWSLDREYNVVEIFRLPSKQHVTTLDLRASGVSHDPTPDLIMLSPLGNRFYVTMRGINLPVGANLTSPGGTPGLAILDITGAGATGSLSHMLPISFPSPVYTDPADSRHNDSDPHGLAIRLR